MVRSNNRCERQARPQFLEHLKSYSACSTNLFSMNFFFRQTNNHFIKLTDSLNLEKNLCMTENWLFILINRRWVHFSKLVQFSFSTFLFMTNCSRSKLLNVLTDPRMRIHFHEIIHFIIQSCHLRLNKVSNDLLAEMQTKLNQLSIRTTRDSLSLPF